MVTATHTRTNIIPVKCALLNDCVVLQMKMKECLIDVLDRFFFSRLVLLFRFSLRYKKGGKTLTYFGDSGVKGSGKVVGLAVEHKGAWVIN